MVIGSDRRVVRGGAWHYAQRLARCAVRRRLGPDLFSPVVGSRVAALVQPAGVVSPSTSDVSDSGLRVVRGGAWSDSQWYIHCAVRLRLGPAYSDDHLGFRVVVPMKLAGVVSQPNSSVLDSGSRVVRSGFWYLDQGLARCAVRDWLAPDLFLDNLGFRVSTLSKGENKMQDFLTQFVDAVAERVAERLGQSQAGLTQTVDIDLVTIPAGEFLYGEDKEPQHLPEYKIGKYPVTNAQYAIFVQGTGYRVPKHWQDGQVPAGKECHPVVNVSWHDAMAFCNWLSGKLGVSVLLPTEAQWEKAARGADGREYPWGNEFDKTKANIWESGIGDTTPVDTYPEGVSPYGVWDMVGNVWEWTNDEWK